MWFLILNMYQNLLTSLCKMYTLGLHPHQTSKSFPLHLYFIVSKIYPKLESKQIRLLNF